VVRRTLRTWNRNARLDIVKIILFEEVSMHRNWTAEEDGQLLEMLRLNCHRAIIAKALDRTEMEIRARVGMLKALGASGENFNGGLAAG
jgi:hypothetical protein